MNRLGRVRLLTSLTALLIAAVILSAGCGPKRPYPIAEEATAYSPATLVPTVEPTVPTPTASFRPTQPADCEDILSFISDITIEDGTLVEPGSTIDKRWLVANDGTCNWDAGYRLMLTSDYGMGAPSEQALYPALSGTEAMIRIVFTAPDEPGTYFSTWSAVSPDGTQFGDPIYIEIEVVSNLPAEEEETEVVEEPAETATPQP